MANKRDILILGEAFGQREAEKGRPFVGPSGKFLDALLASVGVSRSECYLTNVFNFQPAGNDIDTLCGPKSEAIPGYPPLKLGKYVRAEFKSELTRLYSEIVSVNPNIIVALGNTATWAVLKDNRIKRLRGAPTLSITGHKVLPTYHPAAVLREYKLRPIIFADFNKLKRERTFPEVKRPPREFWLEPTLEDLANFESYILAAEYLSVDIETWNKQITCIGFSPSPDRSIVIPFVYKGKPDGNYWPTLGMELAGWGYVRRWLSLGKNIIGQNFQYDARYIWAQYGIPVFSIHADTMLVHHAMQPEMEKSLGFLGSIYTNEPSWKFMRSRTETLKKED